MFVFVEYDMEIVFSILDCIVVFSCGGIIVEGIFDEIWGNEVV